MQNYSIIKIKGEFSIDWGMVVASFFFVTNKQRKLSGQKQSTWVPSGVSVQKSHYHEISDALINLSPNFLFIFVFWLLLSHLMKTKRYLVIIHDLIISTGTSTTHLPLLYTGNCAIIPQLNDKSHFRSLFICLDSLILNSAIEIFHLATTNNQTYSFY